MRLPVDGVVVVVVVGVALVAAVVDANGLELLVLVSGKVGPHLHDGAVVRAGSVENEVVLVQMEDPVDGVVLPRLLGNVVVALPNLELRTVPRVLSDVKTLGGAVESD